MSNNCKILNDPIYGLIEIPYGIIYDLLEHRFYQRLRRINQLGFTQYVYPGATHTRFNHTIGALHLMQKAIRTLQSKGVAISAEEAEATCIAILLHDIGHGPFSHCLEYNLVPIEHEELSIAFMEKLNEEFGGKLSLAIQIFENEYPKKFLHQLLSGQLDMDRMDYLTRDSFFTGVLEGVVGYDRIIKMLHVHNGELVIEHKGLYSVESFLVSRRLMYWQVYLHKTVVCAGEMTIRAIARARDLLRKGHQLDISKSLHYFFSNDFSKDSLKTDAEKILYNFSMLDDTDILSALKSFCEEDDFILSFLSKGLISRKLFRVVMQNEPFDHNFIEKIKQKTLAQFPINEDELEYLVFGGQESNKAYVTGSKEIMIKLASGEVKPMSEWSEHNIRPQEVVKYFICYPKTVSLD
jgi:HD superfamily phosphohydrolase